MWKKILNNKYILGAQLKALPKKGNLVYEYNPFRNYRLTQNMYEYNGQLYTEQQLDEKFKIKLFRYKYEETLYQTKEEVQQAIEIHNQKNEQQHSFDRDVTDELAWGGLGYDESNEPQLHEAGELVDFDTEQLSFSLEHPVNIIPQASYDGSVNLVLNDGINTPKLINSRFSATGKNTYEIVDRTGNNDTNIYDQGSEFELDTSLYKRVTSIPKIVYNGTYSGGNVKVGNYYFYFKLADADGNETDFVGESGLVSVFIGSTPENIHTGQKNENSHKNISFTISNLDNSYSYLIIYYSRSSAEADLNAITEYVKIEKHFTINNAGICNAVITGFEDITQITAADININYNIVDSAKAQAVCQNMLFLGNVHKPEIPYKELQDLSLHFLPYVKNEKYECDINYEYSVNSPSLGYYDTKFIYEKTGYWGNEFYRFGIVYILNNGDLTPVFNIRGGVIKESNVFSNFSLYDQENKRNYITYNEETFSVYSNSDSAPTVMNENVKGVVKLDPNVDTNTIYGIGISVKPEVLQELKKHVRGFFFVRQTRIPTILAQGITIGIDKVSRTPCIPTANGFLKTMASQLDKTHVTTKDIYDVNYISEGFLSRYAFKFEKKKSGLWGKIGKAVLAVGMVVALAAAAVYTGGAALAAIPSVAGSLGIAVGATATATLTGLAVSGTSALLAVGIAAGATAVGMVTTAAIQDWRYSIKRNGEVLKLDGRNTKVPSGYKIVELDKSRTLVQNYLDRIIIKDLDQAEAQAILCPDYAVNTAYYNSIFIGHKHAIQLTRTQGIRMVDGDTTGNYFDNEGRHFYIPEYMDNNNTSSIVCKVVGVPDGIRAVGLSGKIYRSKAGSDKEAWTYEDVGITFKDDLSDADDLILEVKAEDKKINTDVIRGNFGPYLAIDSDKFLPAETVTIYTPGFENMTLDQLFSIRQNDNSPFFAISDRMSILDIENSNKSLLRGQSNTKPYEFTCFRGDCYLCQFTHRLNRNFNDSSAPYNDELVDLKTWKDHFKPGEGTELAKINSGDVNAVQLGMWVTFRIRSSNNLNIRTLDGSNVEESSAVGHPRGFYPHYDMITEGTYKHADSYVYNKGFQRSVGERYNFETPDVPYIKNWFGTRIMYSDVLVNDSYKNGFRVFQGTNFRDYTREYGEIVKLVPFESTLLVVFEHGIGVAPIKERVAAASGAGGDVFINTSNVLPENLHIISDMYGSQWADSVLKVPGKTGNTVQYVYGVDTVAKKIWRTDGNALQCISDAKVQGFLNNNISLGERELTPILGIRNVKTTYNAFKQDVLFTFYDNTYGFEEKVWNLCWNELLSKFITFYSWVPSYMENINNIPFSFDRNTSKWIAKLGTSHSNSSIADGITLSNVIVNNIVGDNGEVVDNFKVFYTYLDKYGNEKTLEKIVHVDNRNGFIGALQLSNRMLPNPELFYQIEFTKERDNYLNYEKFDIKPLVFEDSNNTAVEKIILPPDAKFNGKTVIIYGLYLEDGVNPTDLFSELYYRNKQGIAYADTESNKIECVIYNNGKPSGFKPTIQNSNGTVSTLNLPIFKDKTGKRPTLPRELMLNPDKVVTLLNLKASIKIDDTNLSDLFYNQKAAFEKGTSLIDAGYYESTIAIIPQWNTQFLSTDFWKHGQAGIIDITEDVQPTYWYGKQHPFEFECIVVNDPSIHKIFTNLELVSNKAKPESFHYEIIGEVYDFAKDKKNIYFRQEAIKALWQYNGGDITYNRNLLKIEPEQHKKSADFPKIYYSRQDTINDIEDYYVSMSSIKHDYRHLGGAEIVYYPNRQEYRVWQHSRAVDLNSLNQDDSRSIIAANCQYVEDRWKITINPIIVCYKNEKPWNNNKPRLPIMNSPIPAKTYETIVAKGGNIDIPTEVLKDYEASDIDLNSWLNDGSIYNTSFGEAQNRREVDVRGNFVKVRIRYSGEELAIIDFLNTIYKISYA